jgi:hypothetical protein
MTSLVTIDLDRLRADREKLITKRAEIDSELSALESAERAAIAYGTSTNGARRSVIASHAAVIVSRGDVADKMNYEAAEVVLKAAGHRMKTKAITEALMAVNFGKEVKNFQTALFTAMKRKSKTFQKVGPGEWWLVGVPEIPIKGKEGEEENT